MTATAANEIKGSLGPDFNLLDAFDADRINTADVEDVDLMTIEQRQALNLRMADWFNG